MSNITSCSYRVPLWNYLGFHTYVYGVSNGRMKIEEFKSGLLHTLFVIDGPSYWVDIVMDANPEDRTLPPWLRKILLKGKISRS